MLFTNYSDILFFNVRVLGGKSDWVVLSCLTDKKIRNEKQKKKDYSTRKYKKTAIDFNDCCLYKNDADSSSFF